MDLTILWYVIAGLIGGVAYIIIPPIVTDKTSIIQHIVGGAVLGVILFLGLEVGQPSIIGTPASYLTTITAGYTAIDALKGIFGAKGSSSGYGDTNIPK